MFTGGGRGWHRVPFQPVLFLFAWGAVARVAWTEETPINFDEVFTTYTGYAWVALGLLCPPLALFSWWLIRHCRWRKAALAGMWVRFAADVGQLSVLAIYHVVTALADYNRHVYGEDRVVGRYLVGACLLFSLLLVIRDVWALVVTERISRVIRRVEREGSCA